MGRARLRLWLALSVLLLAVAAPALHLFPTAVPPEAAKAEQRPASPSVRKAEDPTPGPAANEAGQVMVLMYHRFSPQAGDWNRTPDEFRRDLGTLYHQGYRLLPLRALLDGKITTPRGFTPVVLTFDDGWQSQFNYLLSAGQPPALDPDSAVGILTDFARSHPDMGLAGTFYLNADVFGQPAYGQEKLAWLIAHGFEVGNHTYDHLNLRRATGEAGTKNLARLVRLVATLVPGYRMDTMALPFGAMPHDEQVVREGEDDGTTYRYRAVLLVGANPAPSPFSRQFDPYHLPRVQASDVELGRWLAYFQAHPEERFVSDGDPRTVTVPKAREGSLAPGRVAAWGLKLAVVDPGEAQGGRSK